VHRWEDNITMGFSINGMESHGFVNMFIELRVPLDAVLGSLRD